MIRQNETGMEYAEAIDVEGAPYTYTETETPQILKVTTTTTCFLKGDYYV